MNGSHAVRSRATSTVLSLHWNLLRIADHLPTADLVRWLPSVTHGLHWSPEPNGPLAYTARGHPLKIALCSWIPAAALFCAHFALAIPGAPPAAGASSDREDAQSVEERAKREFEAGIQALEKNRWASAESHLRRSLALVPRRRTLYDLAVALYMQHRLVECKALLDQVLRSSEEDGDTRYQQNATHLRDRVQAELSTLRLVVTPPTAEVRIDAEATAANGAERVLQVAPGRHEAEVFAPGAALGTFLIWHSSTARVGTHIGSSKVVSTLTVELP